MHWLKQSTAQMTDFTKLCFSMAQYPHRTRYQLPSSGQQPMAGTVTRATAFLLPSRVAETLRMTQPQRFWPKSKQVCTLQKGCDSRQNACPRCIQLPGSTMNLSMKRTRLVHATLMPTASMQHACTQVQAAWIRRYCKEGALLIAARDDEVNLAGCLLCRLTLLL